MSKWLICKIKIRIQATRCYHLVIMMNQTHFKTTVDSAIQAQTQSQYKHGQDTIAAGERDNNHTNCWTKLSY